MVLVLGKQKGKNIKLAHETTKLEIFLVAYLGTYVQIVV